jgi:hypothetical protein
MAPIDPELAAEGQHALQRRGEGSQVRELLGDRPVERHRPGQASLGRGGLGRFASEIVGPSVQPAAVVVREALADGVAVDGKRADEIPA